MEFEQNLYGAPSRCSQCEGTLHFKGVGEYKCEDCGNVEYDDYGKVRCYIETHRGATAAEIEAAIGVKQKAIRQMLKDEKLEVAPESKIFLRCEMCGTSIRSGHYCVACQNMRQRNEEKTTKKKNNDKVHGFGMSKTGETGEKRFKRE